MFRFSLVRTAVLAVVLIPVVALVAGCGGGGGNHIAPVVTQHTVSGLQYSKTASITLQGRYLDSGMTAQAGSCSNPMFAVSSTAQQAVLTCKVSAVGPIDLVVKDATGQVVYTAALAVPKPQVTLLTSKGSVVLELEPAVVPVTVDNFLGYVNSGYYQGTLFHRVISGFVVQGGGYTTGMVQKPGQLSPIVLETNKGLSNTEGTVAMARRNDPDTATSEFYINLKDNNLALDYKSSTEPGYAVFGTVVQGMDIVKTIASVPTATRDGFADVPTEDVTISFAAQTR